MFKKIFVAAVGILMCSLAGCGGGVKKQEGGPKLTYIGHASIKLETSDGRIILIDPNKYSPTDYEDEADFVLVTHGHGDHTPCNQVKLKENGVQITWKEALVDGEYQRFEYDGIVIEAVVAGGNTNHPIGSGVGYLVTFDGICVYHAGDSSNDEALHVIKEHEIDYAMYPIDGVYNMDAVEATELANIIGATNNIPIHMNNNPNEDKSEKFNPEGKLVITERDSIMLKK